MSLLLTSRQKAHLDRGNKLFFSPEAVGLRQDPDVQAVQELAALDYYFQGWKNLAPRYGKKEVVIVNPKTGEVLREGKNELQGYELNVDDSIPIDEGERIAMELAETQRFIEQGEVPGKFSSMTPDQLEFLQQAVKNHISGGAIDKIGEQGTGGRVYPKSHELAGQTIPAVFKPGQKRARGQVILGQALQNIDTATGTGTHGNTRDALHNEPAAKRPDLLTDINNIRQGNSSINQSAGDAEGDELRRAMKGRKIRLQAERANYEGSDAIDLNAEKLLAIKEGLLVLDGM